MNNQLIIKIQKDSLKEISMKKYKHEILNELFITKIPNAKIWSNGLAISILDEKNQLLPEISGYFCKNGVNDPILKEKIFPKTQQKYINVVLFAVKGNHGYYHWMMDLLPKIQLLKESKKFNLNDIDYFLFNNLNKKFQIEIIEYLNIPKEKIIQLSGSKKKKILFELEDLIIISNIYDIKSKCNLVKKNLLMFNNKNHFKIYKNIYISRNKSRCRRIINEKELIEILKKFNFKILYLEELTIAQQKELFYNSKIVIGPHGARLTNLIFCKKNTKVIEIFSENYTLNIYEEMSKVCKLKYSAFIGKGIVPKNKKIPHCGREDILIDLDLFEKRLKQIIKIKCTTQ